MKILIVDDSKAMRAIVMRALRQAGFAGHTMLEAANGIEALKTIRESSPDLVLCDLNMPGMSGMEVLCAVKQEGLCSRLGFVTAEASADLRLTAKQAGASFVIEKPFMPANFQEALEPLIGR